MNNIPDSEMPARIARFLKEFAKLEEQLPRYLSEEDAAMVLRYLARDMELTHSISHSIGPDGAPPRYRREFIQAVANTIVGTQLADAVVLAGMCAVAAAIASDQKRGT